ncbi:MFS transporter [Chloroflexota bacterium]
MPISKKIRSSRWLATRLPFYYGWVMLPIAMLAQAATSPGQTFGISIFNPSFLETLNISLSQLTGAYMIGTLLAAAPQPYIGGLMDRFGIRRIMTIIVIALGLACFYTATVQSFWMLLVAFFLLRLFGQGALSLLAANIPAMWFHQRLGRVSGLMSVALAGTTAIIPPFILWLIMNFGWRWAYAILGVMVWIILLPILVVLFRNRPEDVGQHLDGLSLNPGVASPKLIHAVDGFEPSEPSFTLKAARRTRAYWIMLGYTAMWSMIATAIYFNLLPLFTSKGLTETQAAATYTVLAISAASIQLAAGALADKLSLSWLLSLATSALTAAIFVLAMVVAPWMGVAYAIFMGIAQGFGGVVSGTLWARYYGREHLGKIRGSIFTVGVAGSSLGPFIMGYIYDQTGSYQVSLWIFIALLIPVAIAALWATPPQKPIKKALQP